MSKHFDNIDAPGTVAVYRAFATKFSAFPPRSRRWRAATGVVGGFGSSTVR